MFTKKKKKKCKENEFSFLVKNKQTKSKTQ